jgi:molybdopterin/thiamine biosynthesis adenylyltransferase
MTDLILTGSDYAKLQGLLTFTNERCAVLLTREVDGGSRRKLVAYELVIPGESDYSGASPIEAELTPDFVASITKRARRESAGLVFAHTHPADQPPHFSATDDRGEQHLAAFFTKRHSSAKHAALVISNGGVRARELGCQEPVRVISVGRTRELLFNPNDDHGTLSKMHHRQILALGATAQRALESLRIAIIGLGGTGSIVAQELMHLGVREFTLVDPDKIESSNLNRVLGATHADIGRLKVDVSADIIESFSQQCNVRKINGDVMQASVAERLIDADILIACTDSHGSRAVIQQVAYQYLIPCIDMGVVITAFERKIRKAFGRVQLLAPGLACLTCSDLLDPAQVRTDMMTPLERQADPYISGAYEPAPAVVSINGTVSSLGVTMLLAVVAGFPSEARHLLYDALTPRLRVVEAPQRDNCYICSRKGALGRSSSWPIFARSA